MKQVAQNYRSGELSVLDVPVALLAHLDGDRGHEGEGGQAVARRQGAGPS
jgi:hypothetical protein